MAKKVTTTPGVPQLPVTRLGPEIMQDQHPALEREWLVTNGIGGFASASLSGANTRRYHGLLIAALQPPLGRTLLLGKLDEEASINGQNYPLYVNEWRGNARSLQGLAWLDTLEMHGTLPSFVYRLGEATLTKTIWMEYGMNTSYVRYHYQAGPDASPLELKVRPMLNSRDYHGMTTGAEDWKFQLENLNVTAEVDSWRIAAWDGAPQWWLMAFERRVWWLSETDRGWNWGFHYRQEEARGLNADEDMYCPGTFVTSLSPGQAVTFAASVAGPEVVGQLYYGSYEREIARQQELLARAHQASGSQKTSSKASKTLNEDMAKLENLADRLTLAADQFIVGRPDPAQFGKLLPDYRTIIAGYPWFNDWGRDTMISLPGLTLATGRYEEAATILRSFSHFVNRGMLPNRFPDNAAQLDESEYNTVDATVWYFDAIEKYTKASGDLSLSQELYPVLSDIISWHIKGTRFNIKVAEEDGMLFSGADGVQLTWMDAKVGEHVITPRRGKPIEISALWYRACRIMQQLAGQFGTTTEVATYKGLADKVAANFERLYWYEPGGYLYDVIDEHGQPDPDLRPNQAIALAVAPELVSLKKRKSALAKVREHLLTPYGLRTLSPHDPAYCPVFAGGPVSRDSAYHQGTVWPWPLGPYALALYHTKASQAELLALLQPFVTQLDEASVGQVNEIFGPEPPYPAVGCTAQAWSVSELLEIWRMGKSKT